MDQSLIAEYNGDVSRPQRSAKRVRCAQNSPSLALDDESEVDTNLPSEPPSAQRQKGAKHDNDFISQQKPKSPDLRVAMDFGTTYTAIAYITLKDDPEAPHTIPRFPEGYSDNQNMRQVPSELVYVKDNSGKFKIYIKYKAHRWLDGSLDRGDFHEICHIKCIKEILDGCRHMHKEGDRLRKSLAILKALGIIKQDEEVIVHILQHYFRHTKKALRRYRSYNESTWSTSSSASHR